MKGKVFISLLVLVGIIGAAMPAQKQVSDDEIYDRVRHKLASDPLVKGGSLQVEVKQGVVTLQGAVELEKQRQRAEKLAKKVSGVKGVVNELKVLRRSAR